MVQKLERFRMKIFIDMFELLITSELISGKLIKNDWS